MIDAPLTHFFPWDMGGDTARPYFMREFAEAGAKHLVLTDFLLRRALAEPGFVGTLRGEMADAGLGFVDAHAPFGAVEDLNTPDASGRRLMLARQAAVLETLPLLGVSTCTFHVGNLGEGADVEACHDLAARALERLLPTAEACGVTLCVENSWGLATTPARLLDLLARFDSPHLGICYDSGHANLVAHGHGFPGVEPDGEVLEKLLPRVVTCHLHDNDGENDQHRMPGAGTVDWTRTMALLARAPRLACVQNEVIASWHRIPVATLCQAFAALVGARPA